MTTTQPTEYPYQAWYQASRTRAYLITNGEEVEGRALRYNEWVSALISNDEAATALAAWKAEIAERDALRAEAATGRRAFVRFGALPEGGCSYNRIDNRPEAGVSVYAAWITEGTVYLDCTETYATVAYGSTSQPYEVTGVDLDARGGDSEPLLSDARIVDRLDGMEWEVVK